MHRRGFVSLAALSALPTLLRSSPGGQPIPNGVVAKGAARVDRVEGVGETATYYDGRTDQLEGLSVGTWRIRPGKTPRGIHSHAEEELIVFSEGTGEISINGKRFRVAPGSITYCAGNLPHGVFNTGAGDMLLYFIKWKA